MTPFDLWKSFTDSKTRVFHAAEGEDLVILACTVFDRITRVTDRQTDGLRWLRRATAVAAVARKNQNFLFRGALQECFSGPRCGS